MAARSKHQVTDEQFSQVVANNLSVAQVILALGLVPAGGNYKTVQNRIQRLALDTSHFTGSGWNVGERYQNVGCPFSWEGILIEKSSYTSTHRLKNRLLGAGLKKRVCESCCNTEWLGNPIPLELHHINGINNDHRIENLQLLCPNCHAQTSSYRGKNQVRAGVVE